MQPITHACLRGINALPSLAELDPSQRVTVRDLALYFGERSNHMNHHIGALFVVLACLGVGLLALQWFQRLKKRDLSQSTKHVCNQVCKQLAITGSDKRLVQRLAKDLQLASPLSLMVCRQSFETLADRWLSQQTDMHPKRLAQRHAQCIRLADQLFGQTAEALDGENIGTNDGWMPDALT